MGAPASVSTPAAILLAGAMIAAAVFFGLRAQAPAPQPAVVESAPMPAPAVAERDAVRRQAAEALAYHRPRLLARCASTPGLPPREFLLNVTFDARGVQLARGMAAPDDAAPDTARCIGDELPPLKIPPPGATVMVEIPLRLP